MTDREMGLIKRIEHVDFSKLFELILKSAASGEREKAIALMLGKISEDDKEIILSILETQDYVAREAIPFYERRKEEYRRSIGRSLFTKNGDLKREIRSTELATEEMKKILAVADNFIKGYLQHVVKARKQMAAAFAETAAKLIESGNTGALSLPSGDGNQEARMERLEEKVDKLLSR